jgi:hypothetical protein
MSDEITPPPAWTADHTEVWLTAHPLPVDFLWPHRDLNPDGTVRMEPVLPRYQLHKGYGFWLRTTPYFPGLFEEIHALFMRVPTDGELPTPDGLAAILKANAAAKGEQLEIL